YVFRFETIDVKAPEDGEVQVESIYISVDPYMRGRMNDTKSYDPPFGLKQPIRGHIVGKIVESKNDDFKVGDYVTGILPWKKVNTVNGDVVRHEASKEVRLYGYLRDLGMTAMTVRIGTL